MQDIHFQEQLKTHSGALSEETWQGQHPKAKDVVFLRNGPEVENEVSFGLIS